MNRSSKKVIIVYDNKKCGENVQYENIKISFKVYE